MVFGQVGHALQAASLFLLAYTSAAASLYHAAASRSDEQLPLTYTSEGWYVVSMTLGNETVRLAVDTGSETLWVRPAGDSRQQGNTTTKGATSFLAASQAGRAPRGFGALQFREEVAHKAASLLATKASAADPEDWSQFGSSERELAKATAPLDAAVGPRFRVQYGRGAVDGEVVGRPLHLQQATQQCKVGVASNEGPFWKKQKTIDGLVGLACSFGLPAGSTDCLLAGRPKVFTLQLTPDGGFLTLGSIPGEYMASLHFMPPSQRCGHWTVPLLGLSVGDDARDPRQDHKAVEAIIDSGTNGIVGPTFDIIKLASLLGADPAPAGDAFGGLVTFYTVKCTTALTLPTVTFTMGARGKEANITLDGSALVKQENEDTKDCYLHLAGWETNSWILGAAFMRQLKAVTFDLDNLQVGFVQ